MENNTEHSASYLGVKQGLKEVVFESDICLGQRGWWLLTMLQDCAR